MEGTRNTRHLSHLTLAVTVAAAALWAIFANRIVPQIIGSAYFGKSLPALNAIIERPVVRDGALAVQRRC